MRAEAKCKDGIFDPNKRICFDGQSNPFRCDYLLESKNEKSTQITFTFELLSLELHMRPFEKLVRIAVQDGAERTVRNIKRLIEFNTI